MIDASEQGLTLRARTGRTGLVKWADLTHASGRIHLAYGDALTIHTAQGVTSCEHILALPAGSQAIDGKAGYSGNTRHRQVSYLLTNEAAERVEVRKRRPLNDTRDVTLNDRWANVARSLAYQPDKDMAVALFERVGQIRRGAVRQFHKVMPDVHRAHRETPAAELSARRKMERSLDQVRAVLHQAVERLRDAPKHLMDRSSSRTHVGAGQGA